jgi:hypothetical protein
MNISHLDISFSVSRANCAMHVLRYDPPFVGVENRRSNRDVQAISLLKPD